MSQVALKDITETEAFAKRFIENILPAIKSSGIQVALEGELGSGKTSFVSAVMKALKSRDHVSSPTYILENLYTNPDGIFVKHWDLYRIPNGSTPEELFETLQPNELRLIEWAARSPEISELCDIRLSIEVVSESERVARVGILDQGRTKGIII